MRRISFVAAMLVAGSAIWAADTTPRVLPGSDIIPAERLADWRSGVTVGVPGGIPTDRKNIIDVTKEPYNADKTGATDAQPAIMKAIGDAKDGDVVFLPAGTYMINHGIGAYGGKSRITIRGAGQEKTFIKPTGKESGGVGVSPADGGDWWYEHRLKVDVTGSYKRGATELTVGDTSVLKDYPKGGIGELVQIAVLNDSKLPVLTCGGYDYARKYITRIVAKTATTVTISPALLFDCPAELKPVMRPVGRYAEFVGIEDLTVDGTNCPSGNSLVAEEECYGCWVKNVTVRQAQNRLIGLGGALRCEIVHCNIAGRKTAAGPNGGGLFLGMSTACLIEDNIISPNTEVDGGSAGNVFAYNYCDDDWIQGDLLGMSIDANHAAHNSFNLYEGNYVPRFQADGYWGSVSNDTAFRNWFHAHTDKTKQWWVAVNLNRFTRDYNIVGNVLGYKGYEWEYQVGMTGFNYDKHYIYSLGFPNMGNGWCNGKTAQASKGQYWADWDPVMGTTIKGVLTERTSDILGKVTLSSGMVQVEQAPMAKGGDYNCFVIVRKVEGKVATVDSSPWEKKLPAEGTELLLFPGSGGFQELDLDVKATALLLGNWNYQDNGVPESESLKGKQLPKSLYLSEKPAWFGNLNWPPFGPDVDFEKNKIPAQIRYEQMMKDKK